MTMKTLTSLVVGAPLVAALPSASGNGTCITTDGEVLKIHGHSYFVHCNTEYIGHSTGEPTNQENFVSCAIQCGDTLGCLAAQYSDAARLCKTLGLIENFKNVVGSHVAVRDFSTKRAKPAITSVSESTLHAIEERTKTVLDVQTCHNNTRNRFTIVDTAHDIYDLYCDTKFVGGQLKIFDEYDAFNFDQFKGCVEVCTKKPSCVAFPFDTSRCTVHDESAVLVPEQGTHSARLKSVEDAERTSNGTVAKRALNYGRRKRGILYHDASKVHAFRGADSHVVWGHNWYSSPYGANCNNNAFPGGTMENGMTFIPTIWSSRDEYLSRVWGDNVHRMVADYQTDSIMAFNEPDIHGHVGGSAMSPREAADGYRRLMQPFTGRLALGAPATTYMRKCSEGGWQWLRHFRDLCRDCHIDFIPIHYYVDSWGNVDTSVRDFQDELRCLVETFQRPIWITEMHYNAPSEAEEIHFLTRMMNFFETNDWISRYSYRTAEKMVKPDGFQTLVEYYYLCYRTDGQSGSCCLDY